MSVRGLLVTDLDGTLLDPERRVPDRNVEAIRRANEAGVAVAIVTGRRQSTIRPEHGKLNGLRYRVAASNGSVILAPDNHSIEAVRALQWDFIDELGSLPELSHAPVICITTGAEPPDPPHGPPDCFVLEAGTRLWTQTWRWTEPETFHPAERDRARSQSLVHVAVHLESREEAHELEALVAPLIPDDAEHHVVVAPYGPGALLEIVPRGGKAWALRYFAESLEVPQGATAAIGDEINDLVLVHAADHPFAVGGSVLAARFPQATEVSDAAHGAVADAIDEFLARLLA